MKVTALLTKRPYVIPLFLFVFVFILGVILASSIGPAWDEPDNMWIGGVYWNFVTRGFNPSVFDVDKNESSYFNGQVFPLDRNLAHLPPVYNYIGTIFAVTAEHVGWPKTGQTIIVSYHIMTALFFGLLVVMTYEFGLLLGLGPMWSLFSALAALLYPTTFGHGLSDSKDTAQAALFITSLYFLVRSTGQGHRKDLIIGAVVWGLGLATKFNAIYVPIIWGAWMMANWLISSKACGAHVGMRFVRSSSSIIYKIFPVHSLRDDAAKRVSSSRRDASQCWPLFIRDLALVLGIGLATVFIVWPYLWFDSIHHTVEVIKYFISVGRGYKFFWDGQMYQSGLGVSYWWYPLESLLYETPLVFFAVILVGVGFIVRSWKKHPELVLLVLWVLIPFLRAFWPWASLYDQLRHFVETIPAFALIAAYGLSRLSRGKLRWVAIGAAVIVIGHLAYINMTYFPYSTGYLNMFAIQPNTNFDRDIEALSIKEGITYLHKKYGNISLFVPIGNHLSWYYLTPQDNSFNYYAYQGAADSITLPNKSSHVSNVELLDALKGAYYLDHEIKRGNAIFAWIYRKKL